MLISLQRYDKSAAGTNGILQQVLTSLMLVDDAESLISKKTKKKKNDTNVRGTDGVIQQAI